MYIQKNWKIEKLQKSIIILDNSTHLATHSLTRPPFRCCCILPFLFFLRYSFSLAITQSNAHIYRNSSIMRMDPQASPRTYNYTHKLDWAKTDEIHTNIASDTRTLTLILGFFSFSITMKIRNERRFIILPLGIFAMLFVWVYLWERENMFKQIFLLLYLV